jgi:hypothetical protein
MDSLYEELNMSVRVCTVYIAKYLSERKILRRKFRNNNETSIL